VGPLDHPKANILNVTTNVAETPDTQGFPAMMKAEKFVIDHHQATVISQSFASAEEAFGSTQSILNLRGRVHRCGRQRRHRARQFR
jgi:hypothetical protein